MNHKDIESLIQRVTKECREFADSQKVEEEMNWEEHVKLCSEDIIAAELIYRSKYDIFDIAYFVENKISSDVMREISENADDIEDVVTLTAQSGLMVHVGLNLAEDGFIKEPFY